MKNVILLVYRAQGDAIILEPVRIAANQKNAWLNASLQTAVLLFLGANITGFLVAPLFILCLAVWLLCVPQWVRTLTTPALLADEYGITDATGTVPGGLVYWNEIAAINTIETPAESLLLLHLHNTEAYLARLPEPTRRMLAGGANTYGTPCVVAQSDLGVPVGEALQILTEARARFAGVRTAAALPASVAEATPTVAATAHWWTAIPPEERTAKPTQPVGRSTDR